MSKIFSLDSSDYPTKVKIIKGTLEILLFDNMFRFCFRLVGCFLVTRIGIRFTPVFLWSHAYISTEELIKER